MISVPEAVGKGESIPLSELRKSKHGQLLCYPGTDLRTFDSRIKQLRKLGIAKLVLEGNSKIGKYGVAGKGCVSIVVKAMRRGNPEPLALKIRRIDADRQSMENDFKLQKFANSFGIGPRALGMTQDMFLMEYVDSTKIGIWFKNLRTRSSKIYARNLIGNILTQCYALDLHGLDHGELSNPSKHILIRNHSVSPEAVIIDYESASKVRKPSNLTSVAQFLFFGTRGEKLRKIVGVNQENEKNALQQQKFIRLLRLYKRSPNDLAFEKITSFINCSLTKH